MRKLFLSLAMVFSAYAAFAQADVRQQEKDIRQFTIAKDGSVTDVKVVRGVHPDLDKEVMRVVTSSPKWNPGKHKGQAVPVMFTFPVMFKM